MITVSIFLVFCMQIKSTIFLENGALNAKFDANKRLYLGFTNLNQNDSIKIEEVITIDKDNKNKEKDFQKRNKQLRR